MNMPAWVVETWNRMNAAFPWIQARRGKTELESSPLSECNPPLLITAEDLELYYYSSDCPFPEQKQLHLYQTSGTSSGRRKRIYYSDADEAAYLSIKEEVFRAVLQGKGLRSALSDMGTGHAEATALAVFKGLGLEADSISFRLPVERHLEKLSAMKPEVLYTMPSILDRILGASDDPGSYGIRQVILVGEIASPGWIRRTAQQLRIPVDRITDTYGSIEVGTIAYYSYDYGRYIVTDGLWAEGVGTEELGEDLEPLPEGEQVLVLTSSVREAFPAVRYVTYDVVRDLRPIMVDGRLRQSFKSLVRRIGPDLKHGEKISIYDIENVVYAYAGKAGLAVEVAGNALRLHIDSDELSPALMEEIRREVEGRIPELGQMIRSGILGGIEVLHGKGPGGASNHSAVKSKRIWYS
ncbi:CoF synthetase [Paenibacillus sp. YPG26]|uniref:CoF synthetase n=1 Tax=Paenibacillus sp. YPG26 TaxID=2878915 RepID=UPI00203F40B7|nr:CoF synthetase [Paenibacillus sp. YPG26]USB33540.1 CoF synthetase [Paenibacillus sp. YPG26]